MEFRQLNTFILVAQLKSFSRAAESLGYSQSAVTVQIQQLEESLHTRLFDRMGKRVMLTVPGTQFLEHAYNVLNEVNKARLFMSDTRELRGQLHIGTIESLCFFRLPALLRLYWEKHPRVAVRVTTGEPEMLIEQMNENEELKQKLDRAESELKDRNIMIENAGSLAEAALKLNDVFEAADRAAQQYLENVRRMAEEGNDVS